MHLSKLMEKYPKIDKRLKELKRELKSLSKEDLAWVLKGFLPPEKKEKPNRPPTDYEIFIDKYGLKPACPYCTSRLYHPHGLDDYGKPRYKCRKCGKTYTIMTGTFADKSTFPLPVQIAVINYTLMGLSLSACRRNLAVDYGWHTSEGTILLYRHKFLKATFRTLWNAEIVGCSSG
ncbi:MAG: IS1 family transposase [Ruminococcaceae bacterium]|nr:IS1 family transposase [Oscillospiraceae bacterium]